jgi:hypothetical protein
MKIAPSSSCCSLLLLDTHDLQRSEIKLRLGCVSGRHKALSLNFGSFDLLAEIFDVLLANLNLILHYFSLSVWYGEDLWDPVETVLELGLGQGLGLPKMSSVPALGCPASCLDFRCLLFTRGGTSVIHPKPPFLLSFH